MRNAAGRQEARQPAGQAVLGGRATHFRTATPRITESAPEPNNSTIHSLARQASVTGRRVSVSGLARHLGLPNTTLRRHYPDVIDEMGAATPPNHPGRSSHDDELRKTTNRLRSENRDLRTHLDIAIAHIQRLTIENDQLRRQAETAGHIRRIPRDG